MTYIAISIERLEKLINDRIYVDNLTVITSNDNYLLSQFENLTRLKIYYYKEQMDFSQCTNLKHLEIDNIYAKTIDLTNLSNLEYLSIGMKRLGVFYYDNIELVKNKIVDVRKYDGHVFKKILQP